LPRGPQDGPADRSAEPDGSLRTPDCPLEKDPSAAARKFPDGYRGSGRNLPVLRGWRRDLEPASCLGLEQTVLARVEAGG